MRFVFAGYTSFPQHITPHHWLERIKAYRGVMEALTQTRQVHSIEQIGEHLSIENAGVNYHFKLFNKYSLGLNRYISTLKPDVVVIHSLHYPLQVIGLRLLLGRRVKIIIQNHAEQPFTGLKRRVLKFADGYVNAYLFASKQMGLDWITQDNLTSPQKIHEVMELSSYFYPVDKQLARQKTGIADEHAYLWVGRLNDNKDPLTVVDAFLKFAATRPGICLYMIYQTDELLPQIRSLIGAHNATHTIKLMGPVPNQELLYWYSSVDFLISGSHYEGSGTAVCEAMSCGCVPLLTDILSFRMLSDQGNIGLLYPPGDKAACFDMLTRSLWLDLPAEKQKARDWFLTCLSFQAIAQRISHIAANC